MKTEIAVVKVENGYVVRMGKLRYIAKTIKEASEIIGSCFDAELKNMENLGNNHFEFNVAGHGSHSS